VGGLVVTNGFTRSFDADLFTVILLPMLLGVATFVTTSTGLIIADGLHSILMNWSGASSVGLWSSGD